ncbi:isoprenyl transferase [Paludicola sp. MB14-C6]|uniref:isoprenyl transferase n=1 Tax=Paludihabitans sp. MB14-C6 TaxID=3070656 RepID=UPI0027DB7371|nr:isoprenyl transferase [Paludicola sp. MB14-C6]WMJ23643.1 isoprenyl transferase [Paludicola sp. MB14-C6]
MAQGVLLPKHIGIIMDGNGRWAKLRGLPRNAGHKMGAKTFRKIVRYCNKLGIKYLTVYAFSTENWKRPQEEVNGILNLLREYLNDAKNYKHENVRTKFIGDLSVFEGDILDKIKECEFESENFTGLTLNIAINYGGRNELLHATKVIAQKVKDGEIQPEDIDEAMMDNHLYTAGQPDVDLIIRPSGEFRLSNFMLWQSAYAEYIFMDILWPDFNEKSLDKALAEFTKRNRRFGGI